MKSSRNPETLMGKRAEEENSSAGEPNSRQQKPE
jgi:hypothetical protein